MVKNYILADMCDARISNLYVFKSMTHTQITEYIKNSIEIFIPYFKQLLFIIQLIIDESEECDPIHQKFYDRIKSKHNLDDMDIRDGTYDEHIDDSIKRIIQKMDIFELLNISVRSSNENIYAISLYSTKIKIKN